MSSASTTPADRISDLEGALQFNSRLDAVESLVRKGMSTARPWWQDGKSVTILGALIAAVLPLATWINNIYANDREYRRVVAEQQEKVRQTYLDRVFKQGLAEGERRQALSLLSALSSDRELQKWAQDELSKADELIHLKQQLAKATQDLSEAQSAKASLTKRMSQRTTADKQELEEAQKRIEASQREVESLRQQIRQQPGLSPAQADLALGPALSSEEESRAAIRSVYEEKQRQLGALLKTPGNPSTAALDGVPPSRAVEGAKRSGVYYHEGQIKDLRGEIDGLEKLYPWLKKQGKP